MNQSSLTENMRNKILYWSENPVFSTDSRDEIKALISQGKDTDLVDRFYRDLEFGTGGLRGIIGAGSNRMNIYNIRRATCALGYYLKKIHPNENDLQVAIAYDSRRFSVEFAQETATVLAAMNIRSFITKEMTPVPLLSYLTRWKKCHAGVCVTASHNPPEYNGFKVYSQDGGQLVPPHDKGVIEIYNQLSNYGDIPFISWNEAQKKGLIFEVGNELLSHYLDMMTEMSFEKSGRENFKIVYSPLHGTGLKPVVSLLKKYGFHDIHIVPEQELGDPNFSTVKSPNPEESDAMALALKLGQKLNADVIMATDPDADRLGVIVKGNSGYITLNGNQLACLLTNYIGHRTKLSKNTEGVVIKTIVTTDLMTEIANFHQLSCEDTLTGFKWIGQRIEQYEQGQITPYKRFICGGEESYGFLIGSYVRDKDAVITAALTCEMLAVYKEKNLTAEDVLDRIYKRHGYYAESLKSITLKGKEGSEKITKIMHDFRQSPPKILAGLKLKSLIDYQNQTSVTFDENANEMAIKELKLPKSDVLQFVFYGGSKISVRPSGTEPKIKFYFSVTEKAPDSICDNPSAWTSFKSSLNEKLSNLEKMMDSMMGTVK